MSFSGRTPKYVNGEVVECTFDSDFLCYFQLKKLGTEDLKYDSVEKIWFVAPGKTLANGLKEVANDADAAKLVAAGKKGVVEVYLDTTKIESYYGDNEELESEWHNGLSGSDPEADVVHLIDDSDRTSDPEFLEAMENLGVSRLRRRVRLTVTEDGEEIDQLNERTVRRGAPTEPDVSSEEVSLDDVNTECNQTDECFPRALSNSPVSSYRNSSQSNHDVDDKLDDDDYSSVLAGQPWYDPTCDHSKLELKEKLRFTGPSQFKEAVQNYAISVGAAIKWPRSSNQIKEAVCANPGCKWRVYASWFGRNEAFIIKAVGEQHTCPRPETNSSATHKWIAKRYLCRFKIDPELNTKNLVTEMYQTYGIHVSNRVCVLAKKEAKKMLEGSLNDAYAKLRPYLLELKKADPEGRFVMEVDPVAGQEFVLFKRIYIGFSCLKKGYLMGCRKLFALDGCFLKGEVKGMILTAVGKDGNNQMFPIAWAVVEGENRDSWGWFITILQEELNLGDGSGWSIISDQQKVLFLDF
ncbi:hypothetical protein LINPERHAP2_LOCUS8579 [Linum perenne]